MWHRQKQQLWTVAFASYPFVHICAVRISMLGCHGVTCPRLSQQTLGAQMPRVTIQESDITGSSQGIPKILLENGIFYDVWCFGILIFWSLATSWLLRNLWISTSSPWTLMKPRSPSSDWALEWLSGWVSASIPRAALLIHSYYNHSLTSVQPLEDIHFFRWKTPCRTAAGDCRCGWHRCSCLVGMAGILNIALMSLGCFVTCYSDYSVKLVLSVVWNCMKSLPSLFEDAQIMKKFGMHDMKQETEDWLWAYSFQQRLPGRDRYVALLELTLEFS